MAFRLSIVTKPKSTCINLKLLPKQNLSKILTQMFASAKKAERIDWVAVSQNAFEISIFAKAFLRLEYIGAEWFP